MQTLWWLHGPLVLFQGMPEAGLEGATQIRMSQQRKKQVHEIYKRSVARRNRANSSCLRRGSLACCIRVAHVSALLEEVSQIVLSMKKKMKVRLCCEPGCQTLGRRGWAKGYCSIHAQQNNLVCTRRSCKDNRVRKRLSLCCEPGCQTTGRRGKAKGWCSVHAPTKKKKGFCDVVKHGQADGEASGEACGEACGECCWRA